MAQEFIRKGIQLLDLGTAYYGLQLMRCALVSVGVFAVVWLLRKTLARERVFLKGALWSLFLPVLFMGKLKFFYEQTIGVLLFTWLPQIFLNHKWIYWLYFVGVFVSMALLFARRRKLQKAVAKLEKRNLTDILHPGSEGLSGGRAVVYITKLPVTPFTIGLCRPKIVAPRVIVEEYCAEEFEAIFLHEQVHIRLGHLWIYFLWDILRSLLWVNPLLTVGVKLLREDMEGICDWVTIQRSGKTPYAYGQLLVKSMRFLQAKGEDFNMYATFMDDGGFQGIRRRMSGIARYKPYKRMALAGTALAAFLCAAGMVCGIKAVSYGRCNENDSLLVYAFDERSKESKLLASDNGSGNTVSYDEGLRGLISYDDSYVYVQREEFERFLQEKNAFGEVFIVFGGFYKLPGFVGRGYLCRYEAGTEGKVARIPYDRHSDDDWMLALIKMM